MKHKTQFYQIDVSNTATMKPDVVISLIINCRHMPTCRLNAEVIAYINDVYSHVMSLAQQQSRVMLMKHEMIQP